MSKDVTKKLLMLNSELFDIKHDLNNKFDYTINTISTTLLTIVSNDNDLTKVSENDLRTLKYCLTKLKNERLDLCHGLGVMTTCSLDIESIIKIIDDILKGFEDVKNSD